MIPGVLPHMIPEVLPPMIPEVLPQLYFVYPHNNSGTNSVGRCVQTWENRVYFWVKVIHIDFQLEKIIPILVLFIVLK